MAITLTHVGRTPGQTQFGLDTFTEHYKANNPADVVMLDNTVPQRGDVHPDYQFMFVTDRYCTETGEQSSALDVIYMGALKDNGVGGPSLPPGQQLYSTAIQSVTSQITTAGDLATNPVTMQYYAPSSRLSFISFDDPGELGTAPDPPGDPVIISVVVQNAAYSPGSIGIEAFIALFFQQFVTDVIEQSEIVPGQFWLNTELKVKTYTAPIFEV